MGISSDIKNKRTENEKHNIISAKHKINTSSSKPSKSSAIIGSKSIKKSKKGLSNNSKHQIDYITNAPPSSSKPARRKSFLIASDSEEDELAEPSGQTESSKNTATTKVQKEPLKSNTPASQKTRINSKTFENIEGDLLPFRGNYSASDSEDEVANNLEPATSKSNPSNLAAPENNIPRNQNTSESTGLAASTIPQSSGNHSDPDEVTIIEKPTKSSRLNLDPQSGEVQEPQSPRSSQMSQSRKRRRPVRVSLYDYEPRTSESSVMKPKRSRKSDPIGYRSTVSSQAPFIPQNRIEDVTNYKTVPDNKTRRTEKDGNSLESLRKRKEEKQKHFEKHTENQQIPPHQQHSDIHQQDQASNKQPSGPSGQQSMTEQKQTKQQQNGENVNQKAAQGAVKKVNGVDQIGKARNNRNINMKERSTDHHSRRVISMSKLNREEEDERKYETNQEDEVRMQHTANNQEVEAAIRQVEL
ncbi:hypothetical protein E3Q18_02537 [Wallemia mellicola]|nr:hypothetical protein E3Q19_02009 [Wallemia mellicola]TIB97539.1 hypothetical protein E3Q18_02537 [Wallemia mellicola]